MTDPLSIAAGVIAIGQLTNGIVEYLFNVKDAPKERDRCALEALNLYSLLIQLRSCHEDASSDKAWHSAIRGLGVQNGPLNQYKHALEQLRRKIDSKSALEEMKFALTWKFIKQDVSDILTRMERLKTLVQLALEIDHIKLSQAIERDTSFIAESIPRLESNIEIVQQHQSRQQRDEILEWLSPTDFPAQQCDYISRRQEGTGRQFIDAAEFREWIDGASQTLFCPVQSAASGVSYVFCSYREQESQTAANMFAAILKQLAQAKPSVPESVTRLHQCHAGQRTKPSLEGILRALETLLTSYSTTYLVIDALDEFPDKEGTRSQFLHQIRLLQAKIDLRLLATSRSIPEIENEFESMPSLEIRANDADVKQFVMGQVYRLPNCIQRDAVLQQTVRDEIVEAVDGMFLLARLHVDSLLDKRTKVKVRRVLENLATGSEALHAAYDEAIKRIEGQLPEDSAIAKKVLSWIIHAKRPLATTEICHALAVEPDTTELDPDNIPDISDLVSVCAGLVTVDEESDIIRLVHYTTQEYFEGTRERWNHLQTDIASTCLTYLCFDVFKSGRCMAPIDPDILVVDISYYRSRLEQNAFFCYVAEHWATHVFPVQEDVCEQAASFLRDKGLVSSAVERLKWTPSFSSLTSRDGFSDNATGLHLAAIFGLRAILERLLESLKEDNVVIGFADERRRTPLSFAAQGGHEAVVELLMERDDVDVDSKNDWAETPLFLAAEHGHEAVVELLMERDDVDVDSKNSWGRTPLSIAAESGHEAVVKLLLERDKALVKLLMEQCAEMDSLDDRRRTLLSYDPYGHEPFYRRAREQEEVVQLLLERDDFEVDLKDDYGRTPLSYAAAKGYEALVKLLIERDVEVNSEDGQGRTPLYYAEDGRHEAVVTILQLKLATSPPNKLRTRDNYNPSLSLDDVPAVNSNKRMHSH